ncbi:MAG: GlyGly-CTERM sorting domain-containing protein [Caldilinea sp. CFX5]|nr:GlyGly-CTERM sorting domain-containing protein [Caldilinea sp. CFX5]
MGSWVSLLMLLSVARRR